MTVIPVEIVGRYVGLAWVSGFVQAEATSKIISINLIDVEYN
jgi:hypothetical protein